MLCYGYNRYNGTEIMKKVFGPNKVAVSMDLEKNMPSVLFYNDREATEKGENWSECAFLNMLIYLYTKRARSIYIVDKDRMKNVKYRNATELYTKVQRRAECKIVYEK